MGRALFLSLCLLCLAVPQVSAAVVPANDPVGQKVQAYFDDVFAKLKMAADQHPTAATFREAMKPVVEGVDGVFGGSYIDNDWTIRQVLFPSHFLARGFSLKKVKELEYFQKKMEEAPGPQLSEPGHGSIVQPRLVAMRYPVMVKGKVTGIVSVMVRTGSFLKAVGLDDKAYEISCLGTVAETHGKLTDNAKTVTLDLPSTTWVIRYE